MDVPLSLFILLSVSPAMDADAPSLEFQALLASILCGFVAFFATISVAAHARLTGPTLRHLLDDPTHHDEAHDLMNQRLRRLRRLRFLRTLSIVMTLAPLTLAPTIALHLRILLAAMWVMVMTSIYLIGSQVFANVRSTAALKVSRWLKPLVWLATILYLPTRLLDDILKRLLPKEAVGSDEAATAVEHMIEKGEEQGAFDEADAELMFSVLEFKSTTVREVMVPRTRVNALHADTPLTELLVQIAAHEHSRYPVYSESIDMITGILYAKDIFPRISDGTFPAATVGDITRAPVFVVQEDSMIRDVLKEMQVRHVHLAVVVDEFGGTAGIVTLEDIIEEIVGEIEDEHDEEEVTIRKINDSIFWVRADTSIADVENATSTELFTDEEAAEYESIGGLILANSDDFPVQGDTIELPTCSFTVLTADERRVIAVEMNVEAPSLPVQS